MIDIEPELYQQMEAMMRLAPNVCEHAMRVLAQEAQRIVDATEYCESPIEQLMSIELERELRRRDMRRGREYVINPQEEVECKSGNKYRLDFLVCVSTHRACAEVGVECDGHDFHEKTKEQAAKDKARDRELLMAGTPMLHFTGSEINKNPGKCAGDVFEYLNEQLAAKERML